MFETPIDALNFLQARLASCSTFVSNGQIMGFTAQDRAMHFSAAAMVKQALERGETGHHEEVVRAASGTGRDE